MLAKIIRVYQLFAQALKLCPLPRTDTSEDTYNRTMVKCHTIIIPIAVMFYDNRKPSSAEKAQQALLTSKEPYFMG